MGMGIPRAQALLCLVSATLGLITPIPNLAPLPGIFWDLLSKGLGGLGSTATFKNKRWISGVLPKDSLPCLTMEIPPSLQVHFSDSGRCLCPEQEEL